MSKFSILTTNKLYFKLIFNSISGKCDPFSSQKKFDHTQLGVLVRGGFVQGFMFGGVRGVWECPRS